MNPNKKQGAEVPASISPITSLALSSSLRVFCYQREIIAQDLIYKQGYRHSIQLPVIDKMVVNSTSKAFIDDRKNIIPILFGLQMITGQRCKTSVALQSIAGFKIRQGQTIGCKVTLRKQSLLRFLDKYISVIMPREGFTGFTLACFDNHGNYTKGGDYLLKFPELETLLDLFDKSFDTRQNKGYNSGGVDLSFVMCKRNPNLRQETDHRFTKTRNRSEGIMHKRYSPLSIDSERRRSNLLLLTALQVIKRTEKG